MTSNNELKLREFIEIVLPDREIRFNIRPNWMNNPFTQRNLELDIFIPELKVAIEYNGIFHSLRRGNQRRNDKLKKTLCKNKNIKLIVIRNEKEINYQLRDFLLKRQKIYESE